MPFPKDMAIRLLRQVLLFGGMAFATFTSFAGEPQAEPMEPCVKSDKPSEPYRWIVKKTQPPAPYRWEGYNDKLVDACLGPNRYRIPANRFYDQMGPDFQGSVGLLMQWPNLQAPPPGKRSDAERARTLIRSYLHYVDLVPVETLLEKSIASPYSDSPHDSGRLEQRSPQAPRFGLTPFYVDAQKFQAYKKELERIYGYAFTSVVLENQEDWYLARDAQGQLTTVIKCDSHLEPDGFVIKGDQLVSDGARRFPQCSHKFVIAAQKLSVSISYSRVFLKDWKRFEDHIRQLMLQYRAA